VKDKGKKEKRLEKEIYKAGACEHMGLKTYLKLRKKTLE